MSRLLKYEMRKTLFLKLIILGLTGAAEIVFLLGLALNQDRVYAVGIIILMLLSFGSIMAIGLYSLIVLHRDMNTRQSYMLFMTPNSSYKILGAKVLENGLSTLIAGAFFFALGALDVTLLFAKEGMLNQLWKTISEVLHTLNSELTLDATTLGAFFLMMLISWFEFITLTYLADVISSALLNGKKWNGLVTVALIIGLQSVFSWVINLSEGLVVSWALASRFLFLSGLSLILAAAMYVVTARIMETRLSV